MNGEARIVAARNFVRSMNILLKFARLYDFGHPRTSAQFEVAWGELGTALGTDQRSGILLSASDNQLLVDGVPLESGATERSFSQLLSAAGVASIHFLPSLTKASLARFVRAFPLGNSNPALLAEQLKAALQGETGIQINQVCFVPADFAAVQGTVAAQLAARSLGDVPEESNPWLNDPKKLLELIVAAEGRRNGEPCEAHSSGPWTGGGGGNGVPNGGGGFFPGGYGLLGETGSGGAGSGDGVRGGFPGGGGYSAETRGIGSWIRATAGLRSNSVAGSRIGSGASQDGLMLVGTGLLQELEKEKKAEEEFRAIVQMMVKIAAASQKTEEPPDLSILGSYVSDLPVPSQFLIRRALEALAAQAPAMDADQPLLLRLAEFAAIRFAMESYERGDVRVNAVQEMLERASREIDCLRAALGMTQGKNSRGGASISPEGALLLRFWSEVTDQEKLRVLLSGEAWCVPPQTIRGFIEERVRREEFQVAGDILGNYAGCLMNPDHDAKRFTATGLAELADLYALADDDVLVPSIRCVGQQLTPGLPDMLQSLIGAAFVRLVKEAMRSQRYAAVVQATESLAAVIQRQSDLGETLRLRIGVENRLPQFIEEAIQTEHVAGDLLAVLRQTPNKTAEHLADRFGRSCFLDECQRLVELMRLLGPESTEYLFELLRNGPAPQAVETVGLLSWLEASRVEAILPERLRHWQRSAQDRTIRKLAEGGARDRGRLLAAIFDSVHPLLRPLALDEIGLSGDRSCTTWLIRQAEGDGFPVEGQYPRLKAIEALGRLRVAAAVAPLEEIVKSRRMWSWANPKELRIVAAQAMRKIDPDAAREILFGTDLRPGDLAIEPLDAEPDSSCTRQRRYQRFRLAQPIKGTANRMRERDQVEVQVMNLAGGLAVWDSSLSPGSLAELRLKLGLRTVQAQVLIRKCQATTKAFEVVDMDIAERTRLRRLLAEARALAVSASPDDRGREESPAGLAAD